MEKIVLLHNHFDMDHLIEVMKEMKQAGAPTIRVYATVDNMYQAIEGCHRLRACAALGLQPKLIELDEDHDFESLDLDFENGDEIKTIGELGDWQNTALCFDDPEFIY